MVQRLKSFGPYTYLTPFIPNLLVIRGVHGAGAGKHSTQSIEALDHSAYRIGRDEVSASNVAYQSRNMIPHQTLPGTKIISIGFETTECGGRSVA